MATEDQLHAVLFGPTPAVFCDVAEVERPGRRHGGLVPQLLDLARPSRHLPRGSVRDAAVPGRGPREGAAGHAGPALRRAGLRTAGVVGAGLEPAGHRLLRRPRRGRRWTDGRCTAWAATPLAALATEAPPRPARSLARSVWNASAWSASPTRASPRCTTRSPAAARSPRRTPSPPRTRTSASPRCPTDRLDAPGRDVEEPQRRARRGAGRRHRRSGRGGEQGRGPRQPVPRRHPRGRRHRVRAAGLRGRRRARADRPARAPAHRRARAGAGRPRDRRERSSPGARRRRSSTAALGDEVAALEAAYAALADGRAALPRRPRRRAARRRCARTSC